MKSIKSFLTILFLLCTFACISSAQTTPEAKADPARSADGSRLVEPGIAAGTNYIGYGWPFADLDIAKEISKPVVVELFSTQGCVFSPIADHFFEDLIVKAPNVIGLSCHVDYIRLDERNLPLSMKACTDRQNEYATNRSSRKTYTPQIVVNGMHESYGFSFDAVLTNLRRGLEKPPQLLNVTKAGKNKYTVQLPPEQPAGAILEVVRYRVPQEGKIIGGQNHDITMKYIRVISSIATLKDWAGKTETSFDAKPGKGEAGAVVLLRTPVQGIVGAAEIKF